MLVISRARTAACLEAAMAELTVKKSVFRAEVFYSASAQEVKALVKRKRVQYRDARHVVHAFVIGETGAVLGCSDDGEPAGTAGRPVLAVLKGSGITNIAVTVTRWFGGTLLGTGGLVKAYTTVVKDALARLPTEPLIACVAFVCECRYEDQERVLRACASLPVKFGDTLFTHKVLLTGTVPVECRDSFSLLVTDSTKGTATVRFQDAVL